MIMLVFCRFLSFLFPDTHVDAFPNTLTPSDSTLHLVDSGHAINIGCIPIVRPERHVDIIIVLSYSWDPQNILKVNGGSAFQTYRPCPWEWSVDTNVTVRHLLRCYSEPLTTAQTIRSHFPKRIMQVWKRNLRRRSMSLRIRRILKRP